MPWIKKREKTFFYIYAVWLLSVLNSRFPGGSGLTGTRTFPFWVLLEVLDDVGGGDNWSCKSCKAAIKSSPPTNQHLRQVFCGVWGSRCVKNAPKVAVVNYVPRSRMTCFRILLSPVWVTSDISKFIRPQLLPCRQVPIYNTRAKSEPSWGESTQFLHVSIISRIRIK